jgi:hypothetical protein
MDKNLEVFTEEVIKNISLEITELCMSKGMPPALASGVLASTLAVYCKTQGLTQHQAISRFTNTIHGIYNHAKPH